MALLDILRERTARRGTHAQVDCGELGQMTVEALPPAECARLQNNPRALLYAACRELQAAGEALRKEGRIFRPDEILEYLTDAEAQTAAQVVLSLSGEVPSAASGETASAFAVPAADTVDPDGAAEAAPAPLAAAEETDEQLIAVISAAIAAVWQGQGSSFVVRRVTRIQNGSPRARAARTEQIYSRK